MSFIKINRIPAFAIAFAFLFKLLFVNIPFLISGGETRAQKVISGHFSSTLKKRKRSDDVIFSSPLQKSYPVELCEVDRLTEENLHKFINPVLLAFLFIWIVNIFPTAPPRNFYEEIKSKLFPRKYLALSTLRI